MRVGQFAHAVDKTGYKADNAYGSTTPLDAVTCVPSSLCESTGTLLPVY